MQQQAVISSPALAMRPLIILVGMMLMMAFAFTPRAQAQADDANKILKAMSDFTSSQKAFSVTYDSDIEVLTTDLQKIQFTSSGQVQAIRPNKLRATRTGGYKDVELVFDRSQECLTVRTVTNHSLCRICLRLICDKTAVTPTINFHH
jgi:hypothetical protein